MKFLTAEEFLLDQGIPIEELKNLPWFDMGNIMTWMEGFAEIHVENFETLLKESNITAKEYNELYIT